MTLVTCWIVRRRPSNLNISGWMAVAITLPVGPTRVDNFTVMYPDPAPTSATAAPLGIASRSRARSGASSLRRSLRSSQSAPSADITGANRRPLSGCTSVWATTPRVAPNASATQYTKDRNLIQVLRPSRLRPRVDRLLRQRVAVVLVELQANAVRIDDVHVLGFGSRRHVDLLADRAGHLRGPRGGGGQPRLPKPRDRPGQVVGHEVGVGKPRVAVRGRQLHFHEAVPAFLIVRVDHLSSRVRKGERHPKAHGLLVERLRLGIILHGNPEDAQRQARASGIP